MAKEAGLEDLPREQQRAAHNPPWESSSVGDIRIVVDTAGETTRKQGAEARRKAFEEAISDLPPVQSVYYTDGSVEGGFGSGGCGITRIEDEGRGPRTWGAAAGQFTSSFRAETLAMKEALEDIAIAPTHIRSFRLYADSLSLLSKLQAAPWKTQPAAMAGIRDQLTDLCRRGRRIQLVWVPGHAGVQGNEEADAAANRGRELNEGPSQGLPVDLASARIAIRQVCRRRWAGAYHEGVPPEHFHRRATEGKPLKTSRGWTRREQRTLHQLRADRCPLLRDILRRWKRAGEDGNCEACLEPENSEHFLLHCPQFQSQRTRFLGPIPALTILQEDPEAVIRYVRATGLLRGARPSATSRAPLET